MKVFVVDGDVVVGLDGKKVLEKKEIPAIIKLFTGKEYRPSEVKKFKKKREVYKIIGEKTDFTAYQTKDGQVLVIFV